MKRLAVLTVALSATLAHAVVDVTFISPEGFSDINHRGTFGQPGPSEVLDLFSRQLVKLGQACIAPEQTLEIRVTDVRLAGRSAWEAGWFQSPDPDVRILRDVDWPSVTLQWRRTGADGTLLSAGSESIADMDYLHHAYRVGDDSSSLPYERAMLSRWFEQRFCPAPAR